MEGALRKAVFGLLVFAGVIITAATGGFFYATTGNCVRYHVEINNLSREPLDDLRLSVGDRPVWRTNRIEPDEGGYLPVSDPFRGPFVLTGTYADSRKNFLARTEHETWEYAQDFEVIVFVVRSDDAAGSKAINNRYGPLYAGSGNPKGFHFSCLDSDVKEILKASFNPERRRALLRDFPVLY